MDQINDSMCFTFLFAHFCCCLLPSSFHGIFFSCRESIYQQIETDEDAMCFFSLVAFYKWLFLLQLFFCLMECFRILTLKTFYEKWYSLKYDAATIQHNKMWGKYLRSQWIWRLLSAKGEGFWWCDLPWLKWRWHPLCIHQMDVTFDTFAFRFGSNYRYPNYI